MGADLSRWGDTIHSAAQEWNVDPRLLGAVIAQESGGDPNAVSKAGARGLTQLMPETAMGKTGGVGWASRT